MYNIASKVKKHRFYSDFQKVKSRLAAYQYVCWIAGGAVRDFCLNREVYEFDLVTDATTEVLKILFPEAILVGESYGVLKIPLPCGEFFDLTTFRQESDYLDGRRPSHVSAATPVKDSERRDFTINSLFWDDVRNVVIDYRGGLFDLYRKKLTCVGDSEARFSEDYLRIVRLVRFSAQLGFEIDEKTNEAALKYKSKINQVSGERIWAELKKISSAASWNFVFRQKLFLALLEEILGVKEINLKDIPDAGVSIFLIIYLIDPGRDFSDVLRKRLKISNQELTVYHSIFFLMSSLNKLSVEELAFEVEKNPHYAEQMRYLVDAGMISESMDQHIKNILNSNPEPLITAKEMLNLMPSRHISEELKYIRIGQFNKTYTAKIDAVEYLKKKYADKRENT